MTIVRYDISIDDLIQDVKNNLKLLDECNKQHNFVLWENDTDAQKQYKCTKCGGIINSVLYYWYNEGLTHGKLYRVEE